MLVNISAILAIVILFAFYNAYLILDGRTPDDVPQNAKFEFAWHAFGAGIFSCIAALAYFIAGKYYAPFVLSSFWLIFGGIVQVVALKKSIFYVGQRAVTDRIIRWVGKAVHVNEQIVCAILKIAAFILSILLIFRK